MANVIRQLPFRPYTSVLRIPRRGDEIDVRPWQIILWVSVSRPGLTELPPSYPCFPTVLDIGLNESFVITKEQLAEWVGLEAEDFDPLHELRLYGNRVRARDADLWIHRNLPFSREQLLDVPPFHVEIDAGILVSPLPNRPRLPLLGLRAIESARLQLLVDGARQLVSIRSSDRND